MRVQIEVEEGLRESKTNRIEGESTPLSTGSQPNHHVRGYQSPFLGSFPSLLSLALFRPLFGFNEKSDIK
jgi:hypothetical protein